MQNAGVRNSTIYLAYSELILSQMTEQEVILSSIMSDHQERNRGVVGEIMSRSTKVDDGDNKLLQCQRQQTDLAKTVKSYESHLRLVDQCECS